jgi:hypothetical protein
MGWAVIEGRSIASRSVSRRGCCGEISPVSKINSDNSPLPSDRLSTAPFREWVCDVT